MQVALIATTGTRHDEGLDHHYSTSEPSPGREAESAASPRATVTRGLVSLADTALSRADDSVLDDNYFDASSAFKVTSKLDLITEHTQVVHNEHNRLIDLRV